MFSLSLFCQHPLMANIKKNLWHWNNKNEQQSKTSHLLFFWPWRWHFWAKPRLTLTPVERPRIILLSLRQQCEEMLQFGVAAMGSLEWGGFGLHFCHVSSSKDHWSLLAFFFYLFSHSTDNHHYNTFYPPQLALPCKNHNIDLSFTQKKTHSRALSFVFHDFFFFFHFSSSLSFSLSPSNTHHPSS